MSQLARYRHRGLIASVAAVALTAIFAIGTPARADEFGQDPTAANITANGSFTVAQVSIPSSGLGFGGGVAYYPNARAGLFPVIAIAPGFSERWSQISWIGPRLASWGFVVVGIDTVTVFDSPTSRGAQLLAALNWAVNISPAEVRDRADGSRRGVSGHSMGGGGTLEALAADSSGQVKAGVALTPWNTDKTWSRVTEPVMIVGGENDTVAPVVTHSIPFYNSLSGSKSYVELNGEGHLFSLSPEPTTSRALVSWFKRWLSNDTRFTPFTCGFTGPAISGFRTNAC